MKNQNKTHLDRYNKPDEEVSSANFTKIKKRDFTNIIKLFSLSQMCCPIVIIFVRFKLKI